MTNKQEILLFHKWSFNGIEAKDKGLKRYLNLTPMVLPHSMGRHEHKRFRKSKVNIIERLINGFMRPGKNAGKKAKATSMVRQALEIINLRTGRNPIEVVVEAVENSAPAEDTTRIGYGGVVYHQSVDLAPQRRIDLALRFLTDGARKASANNPRTIQETLADELILASRKDIKSHGISKRHEIERVAQSSR
ncbi:MAG: 30S ribosomal protein S7 [Candidatus Bathyarchaeota archaeon]|jgi:small subunit ribosomal protein S7|nr:30S ribosomal protein S7 [Candidatus Bathyarchaeota archaeon]